MEFAKGCMGEAGTLSTVQEHMAGRKPCVAPPITALIDAGPNPVAATSAKADVFWVTAQFPAIAPYAPLAIPVL
ncbi:hypothetical protein GCM10010052_19160 [Paenarthrobacter histidinolovorans]|nr:hypothetical protein GCM10010052_19160 [Paenarthrobacter histidinolovorans]